MFMQRQGKVKDAGKFKTCFKIYSNTLANVYM